MEIPILYGSQTGTARYAAEDLRRVFQQNQIAASVKAIDEEELAAWPEKQFFVLVVATTGHGDPPTNMTKFWNFILQRRLPADSLSKCSFAVFGLGDSSYAKFNHIGRMLQKRLVQLGADSVIPLGEGDYQDDFEYEKEFEPWTEKLISEVKNRFAYKEAIGDEEECFVKISKGEKEDEIAFDGEIVQNTRLTAEDKDKTVHLLKIKPFQESSWSFGDVLSVYPENSEQFTKQILDIFNLKGDEILAVEGLFPSKVELSAYTLFKCHIDIEGCPTRYFCQKAAKFAELDIHREKLGMFGEKTKVNSSFRKGETSFTAIVAKKDEILLNCYLTSTV